MDIKIRLHDREKLDNLRLNGVVLKDTLKSLAFINHIFGNHKQLGSKLIKYCKKSPERKHSIVDIGCGGGDTINFLKTKLDQNKIECTFLGIDGNPASLHWASSQNPYKNVTFQNADILEASFKIPSLDILISSHFIYHFNDENLIHFLEKIKQSNVQYVVFSELYRSKWAYYLFKILSPLLPISKLAKQDGLLAIRRAFTLNEIREIIKKSKIKKYQIKKKVWFRMIITLEL